MVTPMDETVPARMAAGDTAKCDRSPCVTISITPPSASAILMISAAAGFLLSSTQMHNRIIIGDKSCMMVPMAAFASWMVRK